MHGRCEPAARFPARLRHYGWVRPRALVRETACGSNSDSWRINTPATRTGQANAALTRSTSTRNGSGNANRQKSAAAPHQEQIQIPASHALPAAMRYENALLRLSLSERGKAPCAITVADLPFPRRTGARPPPSNPFPPTSATAPWRFLTSRQGSLRNSNCANAAES